MNILFRKRKRNIVFLCYLLFYFAFLPGCTNHNNRAEINDATICYSYSNLGYIVIPISEGKYFFIDTGAEMSFILSDRLNINAVDVGTAWVNGKEKLPLKRVDSLQIGDLLITNNDFVFGIAENSFFGKEPTKDTTIVGMIGMDILSQKYCYFDIENQTITFSDEKISKTASPSLVFSYKSPERPLGDLYINDILFEDVLFDTGFNLFFKLRESDKEKLTKQAMIRQDTNYDFFGNYLLTFHEQFDSLSIDGVLFSDKEMSYGQKYRLLGMEFIKHWSIFMINPFKMEIEFYL